ncbi:hypothetical protein F5Y11DRAFT_236140 [Daldinia sp. FL1419]|nr:hypothetical protein F5Y11DRAFT_236140 [Daldinia sp. FL1419]
MVPTPKLSYVHDNPQASWNPWLFFSFLLLLFLYGHAIVSYYNIERFRGFGDVSWLKHYPPTRRLPHATKADRLNYLASESITDRSSRYLPLRGAI